MILSLRRCRCGCENFRHDYTGKTTWRYVCRECGRNGLVRASKPRGTFHRPPVVTGEGVRDGR